MQRWVRSAVVAIATCVIGSSSWAIHLFGPTGESEAYYEGKQRYLERVEQIKEEVSKDYRLGETFELTGSPIDGFSKATYLESLGWLGTMRLAVSRPRWFATAEAAGFADWADFEHEGVSYLYLLVDVDIENVDAASDSEELAGQGLMVPYLELSSQAFRDAADDALGDAYSSAQDGYRCELLYNSGEAEQSIVSNNAVMRIPSGETQTVTLGWRVAYFGDDQARFYQEPFVMYFGMANLIGHCTVHLGTPDLG